MDPIKINKPSIMIGGVEFQCASNSVTLAPGDEYSYCKREWTASIDIVLSYGDDGSWNELNAMAESRQTVQLTPEDTTVSTANPAASFSAIVPTPPFMNDAKKGEFQNFTLELKIDNEPVFAFA